MSHCQHCKMPITIYVVCGDGRCRHDRSFSDEASATRWADRGHACLSRHWLAYGTFDDAEVSLVVGIVQRAGLDVDAARALTVIERDALLGVTAWSSIEDQHWRAALDQLAWLNDEHDS